MKIFNLFSNQKNNPSSPTKPGSKITVKKALDFAKEVDSLEKSLIFLENYIQFILDNEPKISKEIEQITSKTKQNLKKENLVKELWILRYVFLHLWFFNINPPKNQTELEVNVSLIDRAFQDVKSTSDYLPWLKKGFIEYAGISQLKFSNLEEFKLRISEKVSEKVPLIAFQCTEGRLGGELHDFIISLLMRTIMEDGKIFETGKDGIATEEETGKIKDAIEELKIAREEAGKEFFKDLLDDKAQ